jgi:hypothetical protein
VADRFGALNGRLLWSYSSSVYSVIVHSELFIILDITVHLLSCEGWLVIRQVERALFWNFFREVRIALCKFLRKYEHYAIYRNYITKLGFCLRDLLNRATVRLFYHHDALRSPNQPEDPLVRYLHTHKVWTKESLPTVELLDYKLNLSTLAL